MIKSYSKRLSGGEKISEHFRVREFACKDGTDKVLVDDKLVRKLEALRLIVGKSITITSGYRTPAHNRAVGGASNSYHTKGQAADLAVAGKNPRDLARIAQALGFGGIEVNTDGKYLHVDTRTKQYYWLHQNGRDITQSTWGGACPYSVPTQTVKRGQVGNGVRWLQWWLALWGYTVAVDGSFGAKTDAALRDFQKKRSLTADGLCGVKTRAALKGE